MSEKKGYKYTLKDLKKLMKLEKDAIMQEIKKHLGDVKLSKSIIGNSLKFIGLNVLLGLVIAASVGITGFIGIGLASNNMPFLFQMPWVLIPTAVAGGVGIAGLVGLVKGIVEGVSEVKDIIDELVDIRDSKKEISELQKEVDMIDGMTIEQAKKYYSKKYERALSKSNSFEEAHHYQIHEHKRIEEIEEKEEHENFVKELEKQGQKARKGKGKVAKRLLEETKKGKLVAKKQTQTEKPEENQTAQPIDPEVEQSALMEYLEEEYVLTKNKK